MKRVVHVVPTRASWYGGPVRVAEALVAGLSAHGFDCDLVPAAGARAGRLFWPGSAAAIDLARKVRLARLVHVHGLWTLPTSAAAALARGAGIPYVLTPHGMMDRWSLARSHMKKRVWSAVIERRNIGGAAALHFFNEEEADEAADYGRLPGYFLLPNGVDVGAWQRLPSRPALEALVPAAQERFTLLFLGRIHPKKGFDVLIPSMRIALNRTRHRPLHLIVAGPDEGGYRADVDELIRREGVTGHVTFVGEVEGEVKRTLLGGADLFVLPSHQEGDSIAIKEALAAGLPVAISSRCHFATVAARGAGWVVSDDEVAFASALDEAAAEPAPAREQRRESARALGAEYDWPEICRRLAIEYERLIKS